jgi:hypothetical protein
MAVERNEAEREGGEFMIQDRDHLGQSGQMGGETPDRGRRQTGQSQGDSRQQGGGQQNGGQQGGERKQRKAKLL